jgi:molybdate transport system substrate-binding protein
MTDQLRGKLVYGANVRQVLDYVVRGEVEAGVVYATDAMEAGGKVRVVAEAPAGSHRAIEYVGVVVKEAKGAAAGGRFLEYLLGEKSRSVLEGKGFAAGQSHGAVVP